VTAADHESAPDTVPAAGPALGHWIALALVGLVALSVAAPRLRRRVLAVARDRFLVRSRACQRALPENLARLRKPSHR
jgi:hypothetical protein